MEGTPPPADAPRADSTCESRLTRLIAEAGAGGPHAAAELLPLVYEELRALARARLAAERPGRTLQATALVHEAFVRLVGPADPGWNGRGHFFGAAARAMRRILVEEARRRGRQKRGGDRRRAEVTDLDALDGRVEAAERSVDVLALEEVLERLERQDPRKARLVELRLHAGLTNEEAAAALGVSPSTVERDWRFVRAHLAVELGAEGPGRPPG